MVSVHSSVMQSLYSVYPSNFISWFAYWTTRRYGTMYINLWIIKLWMYQLTEVVANYYMLKTSSVSSTACAYEADVHSIH